MDNLAIIGSGPAAYTAAVYAARANLEPLVFTGKLPGGQLTLTTDIENYPGFPEAIGGYELMEKMRVQAERFGAKIESETVAGVEFKANGPQTLVLSSEARREFRAVIVATGASPRWLGLESEERLKNKGVSACATCDGAFFRGVPVVVAGGGDTAMEEATFLTKFASRVFVVHRRRELRASKIMADRAMKNAKIEFVWNSVVEEIMGTAKVEGIRVRDVETDATRDIACEGFFTALGHVPNTKFLADALELDQAGYVKTEGSSSRSSVAGVFAAGDCADHVYRQAITAAGMGCRAAIDAERWLDSQEGNA